MILILAAALLETIIDCHNNGDFIGYITAGNAVLNGEDIYFDYLNTWPPFFSLVSVPLALLDKVAPITLRFVWILGSWVVIFFIMKMAIKIFLQKNLLMPFKKSDSDSELEFQTSYVMVPLILSLRMFIDNNIHLQINLYMLLLATASLYYYYNNRTVLAASILAFSIAIKVYTIFLLLYFLYKRAFKFSLWTLVFVIVFMASTFLFFGTDAIYYHNFWIEDNVLAMPPSNHMNQSLQALLMRLFTDAETGMDFSINIASLPFVTLKRWYYVLVLMVGIYPLLAFKSKLIPTDTSITQIIQWAILFCVIPILSPVAWKYYYVFLWLPIFVFNYFVFHQKILKGTKYAKLAKGFFYASLPGLIFSSELFVGMYYSDVMEVYGVNTIGAILLLFSLFILYHAVQKQGKKEVLLNS